MDRRPHCSQHPDSAAGWRCEDCGRNLCPACTAAQPVETSAFDHCDGRG
ncbi:MAG: hypothetical protein M3Y59_08980 [Myxococcota bacterium]|nr:hypothetical protein [Myxococcota bacterium]